MECYLGDNMLYTKVKLTHKQYLEKIEELNKQYLINSDQTKEFYIEYYADILKCEHYTSLSIIYSYGISDIRLVKLIADEGYSFTI